MGDVINSSGAAISLSDLYGEIANLNGDDMTIDTYEFEQVLSVELTTVEEHITG